jgi:hypothetical protein
MPPEIDIKIYKRFLCKAFGHDWEIKFIHNPSRMAILQCIRCGKVYEKRCKKCDKDHELTWN